MKKLFLLFVILFISSARAEISLKDLSIEQSSETTPVDAKLEKELNERSSKLKTHEVLGLATWGP
jgi:hypothetical protein